MKKTWPLLVLVLILTLVAFFAISRDPIRRSVSVTFLYYTNCDTKGMNDMYTWAWLRIENRSAFELSCQQGVLDAERAGSWTQNTNRIGYQYYPIIAPGQDLTVSINPPADATRWRSSFLLREVIAYDSKSWTRRQRFAAFMDSLRLDRLGLRSQPWHGLPAATVISSKTIDFQTTNALSSAPAK